MSTTERLTSAIVDALRVLDEDPATTVLHHARNLARLLGPEVERIASEREVTARAEALSGTARDFRETAAEVWGGDLAWLTTGTKVANLVADWLDDSAAAVRAALATEPTATEGLTDERAQRGEGRDPDPQLVRPSTGA